MQLFPGSQPRPTGSTAERAVYKALKASTLPWLAFHSLRVRSRRGFEGEGDFVLVAPEVGLLVLEVKGGDIALKDGLWSQNGAPMKKPPRDQAQGYVRELWSILKGRTGEDVPFGVALCFPDCEFSVPPSNGDLEGLVLGARELKYLDEQLPALLARAVTRRPVPTRRWVAEVEKLWGATWVPQVSLADRVADATARVKLDETQLGILEFAQQQPRAVVMGGAGTGKTLLAMELCRRRAAQGQRVLYFSFTNPLAESVEALFARDTTPGRPRAFAIKQYARQLVERTVDLRAVQDSELWKTVSLTAALNALPPVEERPDLIVIDEAQDFDADDWRLVEQLLGERHLWAFTDPRQTFWTEPARGLPAFLLGLAPFQLRQQQRCPDALWNVAALYGREGPEQVPAQLEVGEALKLVEVAPGEHVARIEQEVARLLAAGARPRDIAVLTLSGKDKSALFQLPTLAGQPLVHADAPGASEHLIMDTFLRFKGLERPFVIVSELRGKNVTHYGIRMHLALSRALVSTTVITDADAIAQDAVLVALRAGVSGAR